MCEYADGLRSSSSISGSSISTYQCVSMLMKVCVVVVVVLIVVAVSVLTSV